MLRVNKMEVEYFMHLKYQGKKKIRSKTAIASSITEKLSSYDCPRDHTANSVLL